MGRTTIAEKKANKEMASFSKNYATNSQICDKALAHFTPMIRWAKTNRKAKEVEWLEDLRLWASQQSDSQMYVGRSNLIIPELHNQVESSVGQFMQGIFPNDDYIGCIPNKTTNEDEAEDIKDAVKHELDHKNDLPSLMERFERQKVLYGSAFLKPVFEEKLKQVVMKSTKGYPEMRTVPQFRGVKVHSLDTFHTYAWPETMENLQDCELVFDESLILGRDVKKNSLYVNTENIPEVNNDFSDFGWIDTIRMGITNMATATNAQRMGVILTECWGDFNIIGDEYVPCVVTFANYSRVIRIQRNPFWHQLKPYLLGRYIKGPSGELLGHSLPERIRSLQYMITDIGNQTMDSLTYSLNPIALIDPGFAGDVNSFKMQPGARWLASPQGVAFQTFPDISNSGFQGMQQIRAMIQQFSDLAPSTAPQLTGKVRSATQAQAVQGEMSQNLRNMVRSDEFDVLNPLCSMTHWLLQQFQTEEAQIIVQGPEKGQWITKTVNPETLQKDCLFVWRGSEVAQATAVRSQQLLSAYNMALQSAQILPGKIDLAEFFKKVMYEAFNLKDLNIFVDDRQKKTIDPDIENISLVGGEDVDVNPGDDDAGHIKSHVESYKTKAKTQESKIAHLKHIESHTVQEKAKEMAQQQDAKIQAAQMQLGAQGGPHGQQPQQMGPGNRSQVQTPSNPSQLLQGLRGTEPNV